MFEAFKVTFKFETYGHMENDFECDVNANGVFVCVCDSPIGGYAWN